MKLIWSPETSSKAYIDTVKSCKVFEESSVAELISAMAAGWNSKLITETWSQGSTISTSIGLSIASYHTNGRHVCIVPDESSKSEYSKSMSKAGMSPEIIVGESEETIKQLIGIDFLVMDSMWLDFGRIVKLAKLGGRGAVLVCKNASSKTVAEFRWSVLGSGARVVRSVFLPVGSGLDVVHVATSGDRKKKSRWIKYTDRNSGEEFVIRR